MATATAKLRDVLEDYKDPFAKYLHPQVKAKYTQHAEQALRDVRRLLAEGANWRKAGDPETADLAGSSEDAAFSASNLHDPRPLEILLDHGVPADHVSRSGRTLLHQAASSGSVRVIKLLVERGASPLARWHDRTPLDIARESKHAAAGATATHPPHEGGREDGPADVFRDRRSRASRWASTSATGSVCRTRRASARRSGSRARELTAHSARSSVPLAWWGEPGLRRGQRRFAQRAITRDTTRSLASRTLSAPTLAARPS